jgi:hypothetical protein
MKSAATPDGIEQTRSFLWMRIVCSSIMAIAGIIQLCTSYKDASNWLSSLSFACFLAFFRYRQPGESWRIYLTNPRAIITILSALTGLVTTGVWLLRLAQ